MPRDSMSFVLDGSVDLPSFETAVRAFRQSVDALSKEVSPNGEINWIVDVLEIGSAMLGVRGEDADTADIERVVSAYEVVGRALEQGNDVPFSPPVRRHFRQLLSVLNGAIPSVRLETPDEDFLIRTAPVAQPRRRQGAPKRVTYGAVRGRIQTLTSRNRLRFTLYDRVEGRPVSCWLTEDQHELVRDAWDKLASVEGQVTRDDVGRPTSIRGVTSIVPIPEPRGDWRRAAGALSWQPGDEPAEATIRRLRDA